MLQNQEQSCHTRRIIEVSREFTGLRCECILVIVFRARESTGSHFLTPCQLASLSVRGTQSVLGALGSARGQAVNCERKESSNAAVATRSSRRTLRCH